jgi:hypothetical protein
MFEAVEFIDRNERPGEPPEERLLGTFNDEAEAIARARTMRDAFSHTEDYAWWIVRQTGAQLARWIADSRSHKEFVLDLTSGELVEVQ